MSTTCGNESSSIIDFEYAISGGNLRRDRNADAFDIATAYHELYELYGSDTDIAVRNATAEDFPNASFAGQQETYLKVSGIKENGVLKYFVGVKAQV